MTELPLPPAPPSPPAPVVHLVDADCPQSAAATVRLLIDRLPGPQAVLALGPGPHADELARLGVAFDRVPLVGPAQPARCQQLGRRLAAMLRKPLPLDGPGPPDEVGRGGGAPLPLDGPGPRAAGGGSGLGRLILHAHSPQAARTAAWATIGRPALARAPMVVELARGGEDSLGALGWIARLADRRAGWEVSVVARSQELRRLAAGAGFPADGIGAMRPPIEQARVNAADRAAARANLGLADGDGPVLLAGGWCRRDEDQRQAIWAAAVVNLLVPRLRIVAPGDGPLRDSLRHWISRAGFGGMCRFPGAALDWPDLLAAADLMVYASGQAADTTPVAWAMAAGLPVVAVAVAGTCELIEDHHNGLLAQPYDPRDLARQVRLLLADEPLRRKLTDQARHEAFHYFNPSDAVAGYRVLYAHLAGATHFVRAQG